MLRLKRFQRTSFTVPRTRLQLVGFKAARFRKDPCKGMTDLQQRISKQQAQMKQYADSRRAVREHRSRVDDYDRVHRPQGRGK